MLMRISLLVLALVVIVFVGPSCGGKAKSAINRLIPDSEAGIEPTAGESGGVTPIVQGDGVQPFPMSYYEGPFSFNGSTRVSRRQAEMILEEELGRTTSDMDMWGRYEETFGLVYGTSDYDVQAPSDIERPLAVCPAVPPPPAEVVRVMVVFFDLTASAGEPNAAGAVLLGSSSQYVDRRFNGFYGSPDDLCFENNQFMGFNTWMSWVSRQKLPLEFDFFGYNPGNLNPGAPSFGGTPGWYVTDEYHEVPENDVQLVKEIIYQIEHDVSLTTEMPDFDWNDYDSDGNGDVDAMIIVYNGEFENMYNNPRAQGLLHEGVYPEQTGDDVVRLNPLETGELWSGRPQGTEEKVIVSRAAFIPISSQPEPGVYVYSNLRVIEHEFMHLLGAPDMYDISESPGVYDGDECMGTGLWDLMCYGTWVYVRYWFDVFPNPCIRLELWGDAWEGEQHFNHDILLEVTSSDDLRHVYLHSSEYGVDGAPQVSPLPLQADFLIIDPPQDDGGYPYSEMTDSKFVIEKRSASHAHYPPYRSDLRLERIPYPGDDCASFLVWRMCDGVFENYLKGRMPFNPPEGLQYGVNDFEDYYAHNNEYLVPSSSTDIDDRMHVVGKYIDLVEAGGAFAFTDYQDGTRFPAIDYDYSDSATHLDVGDWIGAPFSDVTLTLHDQDCVLAANHMDFLGAGYSTLFAFPGSYSISLLRGLVTESVFSPDELSTMSSGDMLNTALFPEYPSYWLNNPAVNVENSYRCQPIRDSYYPVGFVPGYTGSGFDPTVNPLGTITVDPYFNGEDIKFPSSLEYHGGRWATFVGDRYLTGNPGDEFEEPLSLLDVTSVAPYVESVELGPEMIVIEGHNFTLPACSSGQKEIAVLVWPARKLPPIKLDYEDDAVRYVLDPQRLTFVLNRECIDGTGQGGFVFGDTIHWVDGTRNPGMFGVAPNLHPNVNLLTDTRIELIPPEDTRWEFSSAYETFYAQVYRNYFPSNAFEVVNPNLVDVVVDLGQSTGIMNLYDYLAVKAGVDQLDAVFAVPPLTFGEGGNAGVYVPPFFAREYSWMMPMSLNP